MKISVTVKARAKENRVEKVDAAHYRVSVKAIPDKGKANQEVVKVLARHFGIPQSSVQILTGHTFKKKIVVIQGGT